MIQSNGKLFPDPTFTPPDLPESACEFPDDERLYFVERVRDVLPVWRRYTLIGGLFVEIAADEQK